MGWRKFSDRPPVRQRIHHDDETKQWSAAISSWTEDERLQGSTQAAPKWRKEWLLSFRENSKHDKEAGPARCKDRGYVNTPEQQQGGCIKTWCTNKAYCEQAQEKVESLLLKIKYSYMWPGPQICPMVGLGKGSVLPTWDTSSSYHKRKRGRLENKGREECGCRTAAEMEMC